MFDHSQAPPSSTYTDGKSVELGVKLTAKAALRVCAVVFYKSNGLQGMINVKLWSPAGAALGSGQANVTGPAAWTTIKLDVPVDLLSGQQVVASYNTPDTYEASIGTLPADSPQLTPTGAAYAYGPSGSFPANASGANYYVDVVATTA